MKKFTTAIFVLAILSVFLISGCDDSSTKCPVCPGSSAETYWVSVTVTNPQGQPQGGAIVTLVNPPNQTGTFIDTTDQNGHATIQAPAGQQSINVTMGTVMQGTINVNVTNTGTATNPQTITTPIQLTQNTTTKKVLVVKASAEQLEDVLRVIGFTSFDSTDISTLIDQASTDSTALLNYLKQYSLIFSDCDGGSEGYDSYAPLSRTYGRYVAQGGKIYGGHYNYYHLGRIWPNYYSDLNIDSQGDTYIDSLYVTDANLRAALGFQIASWSSSIDSRRLSGYEKWSSYPTNAKIYAVIYRTSPSVGVIVENYVGTGKYLWTDYHNQDIKNDPQLVKIVQYFLLSM